MENENFNKIVEYIRNMGFEVTIDENPSPEKLQRINKYINRTTFLTNNPII